MLNESIRIDMNTVDISLSSEDSLCRWFGHPMRYIHGKQKQNTWKKVLKKITAALKKSIKMNINSDGFHERRLNLHIEQLEDACKSKNNVDPEIILTLTGIIFELLGGTPDYSARNRLNKKTDFTLNKLRSLNYIHTPYQKVCTILEASRYLPFSDLHKYRDLFQEYVTNFNGNPNGFLNWYKEEYPEIYIELF
jgi:hypothetical protein